jgi:hypothetical protein
MGIPGSQNANKVFSHLGTKFQTLIQNLTSRYVHVSVKLTIKKGSLFIVQECLLVIVDRGAAFGMNPNYKFFCEKKFEAFISLKYTK